MMTQLDPSLTMVAQLPAAAPVMVVPAAPPAAGTTLDEADTTENATVVLNVMRRPVQEDAAGSVTTQLLPAFVLMMSFSLSASVKSAAFVTGAPRDSHPLMFSPALPWFEYV